MSPRRLKAAASFADLRRGSKPRPFKTEPPRRFFIRLLRKVHARPRVEAAVRLTLPSKTGGILTRDKLRGGGIVCFAVASDHGLSKRERFEMKDCVKSKTRVTVLPRRRRLVLSR